MIATSRSAYDGWKGRALSQIVPRPIALDHLQSFFVEYLKGRGQGDVLRDDELVPAQNQLRRIVGDKPITALLAQMFIDDVIANRQRGLLAGQATKRTPWWRNTAGASSGTTQTAGIPCRCSPAAADRDSVEAFTTSPWAAARRTVA